MVMRTDAQQGILLNIVVGIVGAILGGLLLAPMLGGGSITNGDFSLPNLLISLLGAIILLAIVNLVRRGSRPLSDERNAKRRAARIHPGGPFFDY